MLPRNPRTAVIWAALAADLGRGTALDVVDAGGGTGGFAVPLAQAGHRVTVVDPSPDALAALTRRAADAGVAALITSIQGDADRLGEFVPPGRADLVLCHSVLELVDDPGRVAAGLAATLRPGGAASVLVANQHAAVLARAVAGQLDAACDLLAGTTSEPGAGDRLRRRYTAGSAQALLAGAGLVVEQIHGVRVIADLLSGAVAEHDPAALLRFELAAADRLPYRDLATQLHLYARRPA